MKTNLNAKKVCENLFFYFTQQREESASITGYLLQEKELTLLKNFNEGKYDSTVTTGWTRFTEWGSWTSFANITGGFRLIYEIYRITCLL